jgi:glycosyltransferase involved in cell wall biosynthesis
MLSLPSRKNGLGAEEFGTAGSVRARRPNPSSAPHVFPAHESFRGALSPGTEAGRHVQYPLDWWLTLARDSTRLVGAKRARLPARLRDRIDENRQVRLEPARGQRGNVLLSYMLEPFLPDPTSKAVSHAHSRFWECHEMASAFLEEGFTVDVIRYTNRTFVPRQPYDFIIDARRNMERLAPMLGPRCIKMMHLDTSHLLVHSAAELNRLHALYRRRGVALQPRRFERPNRGLETADCATLIGNERTRSTYGPVNKPIYLLPVTPTPLHPQMRPRDADAIRCNFVWFNSMGMVHKGLDLVLEAFAAMPDLNLTICGRVEEEEDFVAAYRRELFETPNIRLVGWLDAGSPKLREILDTSIATILASCAEGQSSAVVSCMYAGVIPIVSRECGIDVREDFGIMLETCSVAEIQAAVRRIAQMPTDRLEAMSDAALKFAQTNHTRERFSAIYRGIVRELIARHGK